MLLPIIDLTRLTELTNKDNKEEKATLAKLKSVSSSAIRPLEKAISYSEELANHVGSNGKSVASYRQEMAERVNQLDSVNFHHLVNNYRSDISKVTMLDWYKEQRQTLNDAETWVKLSNACKDESQRRKIQSLRSKWESQQKYAIYTSQSLIALTKQALLFESYLDMLSTEFRYYQSKLSERTRDYIQGYMISLETQIKQEEEVLAQSMLIRLKAASSSNHITFDDVTVHFASKLKQLHVLEENYRLPAESRHGLDRDTLQYFQGYITQWGNPFQIKQLSLLKWNQPDNKHTVIKNGDQWLPVPRVIADNIQNRGIIDIIFDRETGRKKFLANQVGLLAHLRYLPNPKEDFTSLFTFGENKKWQHLCHLSDMLSTECELARKNIRSLSWLELMFNQAQFKFVNSWSQYLQTQQKALVNPMLAYAKLIGDEINTRISLNLDLEQVLSTQFQSQLENFHYALSLAVARSGLDETQCTAYSLFSAQFNRLKNISPPIPLEKRLETLEEKLAQFKEEQERIDRSLKEGGEENKMQKAPGEPEMSDSSTLNSRFNDPNPFQPIPSEKFLLNKLEALLISLLPEDGQLIDLSNDTMIVLKEIEPILKGMKIDDFADLADTSEKLLIAYINFWVNSPKEEKDEVKLKICESFESILQQLPSVQSTFKNFISTRDICDWRAFIANYNPALSSLEPDKCQEYLNSSDYSSPVDKEAMLETSKKKASASSKPPAFFCHPINPNDETAHPTSVVYKKN